MSIKIKMLKDGMRKIDVEAVVESVGDARTVDLRTGGTERVADAIVKADSGSITLTLWGEQTELKVGTKIKVENGYTNSFRGEVKLNVGKWGSLSEIKTFK